MDASDKGTNGAWFLDAEAECGDEDGIEDGILESLFDCSTDSDASGLIDNSEVSQGNTLALFNSQQNADDTEHIQLLKRKYADSPEQQLSPRLQAISLDAPRSQSQSSSKRKLFPDSGVDSLGNGGETSSATVEVPYDEVDNLVGIRASNLNESLLRGSNVSAARLSIFKETFGVGFKDLTRYFKSDKTCCPCWVCIVFGASEELAECSKKLLESHCEFMFCKFLDSKVGLIVLYMLQFNATKSRETVRKLMKQTLNVSENQIMAEPPKIRSVPAALYWYKATFNKAAYCKGSLPDWVAKQTLVTHQLEEKQPFDFSQMVQWAYDNNVTSEAEIAYDYACLAETDANAQAWLSCNSQAKFVKDCATMVKHYRRAEMSRMTMSQWIWKQSKTFESGDWSQIPRFLKFQGVNFLAFLIAFKEFLKGTPKKNCIVISGPPDTGKSMFTLSLIRFMRGKVISFQNSKSHFWLQPLADCKMALLDDATGPCWDYIDTYLRNGLDGNEVCLDSKHRAPMQIRFPPILITSNINIEHNDAYRYLLSRTSRFTFPEKFPFNSDGTPGFQITENSWKSLFLKIRTQLELSEDDECEGEAAESFRCAARQNNSNI